MDAFGIISAAVYLFAKNENGEWCVLCGKRSGNDPRYRGGMFDVPCGLREIGESLTENALRELNEETGISLSASDIRFIEKHPWGNGNYGANFFGVLDSCIDPPGGDWEHEFVQWLPLSEIGKFQWAYGMDKKALEMFNKYVKDTMTISEETLRDIICEVIMEAIDERGTNMESLYHFTDLDNLKGIVTSGVLNTNKYQRDKRNQRRFVSFTRHKSNLEGFAMPRMCNVRIEVDGRGLSNVKYANTYPFEYYSPKRPWNNMFHNGKDSAKVMYSMTKKDGHFGGEGAYMHQAEESFETLDEHLNISNITRSIDVLLPPNFVQRVKNGGDARTSKIVSVLFNCSLSNSPLVSLVNVYFTKRDFNLQTGNSLKIGEFLDKVYEMTEPTAVAVEQ